MRPARTIVLQLPGWTLPFRGGGEGGETRRTRGPPAVRGRGKSSGAVGSRDRAGSQSVSLSPSLLVLPVCHGGEAGGDQLELRQMLRTATAALDPPLLEGFNLTMKPGMRVALVGYSASGKSTVAKLIRRAVPAVRSGEILLDGQPRDETAAGPGHETRWPWSIRISSCSRGRVRDVADDVGQAPSPTSTWFQAAKGRQHPRRTLAARPGRVTRARWKRAAWKL